MMKKSDSSIPGIYSLVGDINIKQTNWTRFWVFEVEVGFGQWLSGRSI